MNSVDKEEEFIKQVDKKIRQGADIIYENYSNIENNLFDLFLVAPCVFDEEMMKSLLLDYRALDMMMGNFEKVYSQIDNPVTVGQAIMLDTLMKKLDKLFEQCVSYIYTCNNKVESHDFHIGKAQLLEKLDNHFNYEVVHWKDLDHAFNNPYLVATVSDVLDESYDNDYYPLHTLRLKNFPDKTSAYRYCLANGLSKDHLILRW